MSRSLLILAPLLGMGCFTETKTDAPAEVTATNSAFRSVFDGQMLEIAKAYESYQLLIPNLNFVATDCRPIGSASDTSLYFSQSTDSQTHGRKMYVVFAKDVPRGTYSYIPRAKSTPVGQAIVKEAWTPEEVPDDGKPMWQQPAIRRRSNQNFVPYLRKDGHLYHAKEKSALFVMFKMDSKTPDTDEGWVYGTVTPDGKKVTSAGKVESCMKCHQEAPHDRLFGLPADK